VHHIQEKDFFLSNVHQGEHATCERRIFKQINSSFHLYQEHLEIDLVPFRNRFQEPRQVRFHESHEKPRNHDAQIRRTNFWPVSTTSKANQGNKNLRSSNSFPLPVMYDRVQTNGKSDGRSKFCILHDFIAQDSMNCKNVRLEPTLQPFIKENKNDKKRGNGMNHVHHRVKRNKYNTGQWTEKEQEAFLLGLRRHGKKWTVIGKSLKTRSPTQIKSHGQEMLKKLAAGQDIFAVLERNASDAIKARISDAEADAAKAIFAMKSIEIEFASHEK